MVLDPYNALNCPTLSAASGEGLAGLGITSFDACTFSDGQGSPTAYDSLSYLRVSLSNNMRMQQSRKAVSGHTIANGCTPGIIDGSIAIRQQSGASQIIPATAGTYPFQVKLYTGDLTHYDMLDLSMSYDSDGIALTAEDLIYNPFGYTLFNKSAGATTTGSWSFTLSYV
jgi:hypothetical protein